MVPRVRAALVVAAGLLAGLTAGAPAEAGVRDGCAGRHWVGAWATSPGWTASPGIIDQSLRMIVNPTLSGQVLRVRLSNRFGTQPVTFASASVAHRSYGAALVPGTLKPLRFKGRPGVVVAAGGEVVSDAVRLRFRAFQDLAVSVHAAGPTGPMTDHYFGLETAFLTAPGTGDQTAEPSAAPYTLPIESRPFLTDVEVQASKRVGAVVTLGDSITDGVLSTLGANARWPDFLARRLVARGRPRLAVQNAGIGSNRILSPSGAFYGGPPALERLATDVIDQAGVTDVVVMEGTNDIGHSFDPNALAKAEAVEAGLRQIVTRLHAAGLRVIVGTQAPAKGLSPVGLHGSDPAIAERNKINEWVRTTKPGDGVADFHAALRDPADPDRLLLAYDGGDKLHPSDAGYRAMADAVPLRLLQGPACGPPIDLRATPRRAAAGARARFVFRATVGRGARRRPLRGASIWFGDRTLVTGRRGRAAVTLEPPEAGRYLARASRRGYGRGRAAVVVRARP